MRGGDEKMTVQLIAPASPLDHPSTRLRLVPFPTGSAGREAETPATFNFFDFAYPLGPAGSACFTSSISAHGSARCRRTRPGTVSTV